MQSMEHTVIFHVKQTKGWSLSTVSNPYAKEEVTLTFYVTCNEIIGGVHVEINEKAFIDICNLSQFFNLNLL